MSRSSGTVVLAALCVSLLAASCGGGGGSAAGDIQVRIGGEGQILGSGPGEQVGLSVVKYGVKDDAAIWHGDLSRHATLKADGFDSLQLFATDGFTQGGEALPSGWSEDFLPWHAVMFKGTSASMVDLHPSAFFSSKVEDVEGDTQVGFGRLAGPGAHNHPLLWHGSRASVVDLLPAGATSGTARAIMGGVEYGLVLFPDTEGFHAARWQGTAASYQDLNPAGYDSSAIYGASTTDRVGIATRFVDLDIDQHAYRWTGNSGVDLHPGTAWFSAAEATDGVTQVGFYIPTPDNPYPARACLWHGTAESFVDLHALLPPGYGKSEAMGVSGKIVSGWASDLSDEHPVPVIWVLP